jgi:hypothetical protein
MGVLGVVFRFAGYTNRVADPLKSESAFGRDLTQERSDRQLLLAWLAKVRIYGFLA